jgi:hypothetical protein
LIDLRNKLTLVVNLKQTDLIKYFSDIFEEVINLGESYLSLLETGNILFKNWTAQIYCNSEFKFTMRINFGLDGNTSGLTMADRRVEKTTINSLNKLNKFLKNCENNWLKQVNLKRENFNELNYFRVDQIALLRTEFALNVKTINEYNVTQNKELKPTLNLVNLLHNLNPNVTIKLLSESYEYASAMIANEIPSCVKDTDGDIDQELLEEIVDLGFEEDLVRRTLKTLKTTDRDKIIEYCQEHESSSEEQKPAKNFAILTRGQNLELKSFAKLKRDQLEAQDVYALQFSQEDLLENHLKNLWSDFEKYADADFDEFISLNRLCWLLHRLKREASIYRECPPYIEQGTPNLIVCLQEEIIVKTMEIYALSPQQPLPNDDEILYCTPQTTYEDVELFWKRLLSDKLNDKKVTRKIYSIVNAHDLSYDLARKSVSAFQTMLANYQSPQGQNRNQEYLLCIICSSERENKSESVFATHFNRYKKKLPINQDPSDIRKYVISHFSSVASTVRITDENLSARVITSDRSSTGKSLFVQRIREENQEANQRQIEYCCIAVKSKTLPFEDIFRKLKQFDSDKPNVKMARIIHFDIAFEVWYDVDSFLFQLLIMSVLQSYNGELWRRDMTDLFLIEIMSPRIVSTGKVSKPLHSILSILPELKCLPPQETLELFASLKDNNNLLGK